MRGLECLRGAGVTPDERVTEAIDLLLSKRNREGRWLLETRLPGLMPVEFGEGVGLPSRWITLRALQRHLLPLGEGNGLAPGDCPGSG